MPNWCSTVIAFWSNEDCALDAFRENIIRALEILPIVDNESENWQGRVSRYFDTSAKGERGFIQDISPIEKIWSDGHIKHYFTVSQEDAWGPHISMWSGIINESELNISIDYTAEEPGCGIYVNTDTEGIFFPDRYLCDCSIGCEYFSAEGDMIERLKEIDGAFKDCESIRQAQYIAEKLVDEKKFDWFVIEEFQDS